MRAEAESILKEIRTGPQSGESKREEIDEYGWRHFGEWYADHEKRYYQGNAPLVSHYNNQYDLVYGLLLHWFRTADPFYWDEATRLARHVIDIDIYHTDQDRPVYNGGLFWHTDHYLSAGTATHRTFSHLNASRLGKHYGGGPSNEHNYTTGLLHYYFQTGDWTAREAVIGLAQWVLNRDDGYNSVLGLVTPRPTGLASSTTHGHYHGPGRGAGNTINALFDAWWLTNDYRYLEQAQKLIARTIHPDDDWQKLNLGHIEHRWSYTVYLAVLLRYAFLLTSDRSDESVGYVRQCMKHYAQAMFENETPYFDRETELEFPTETWGAHDVRKGNLLELMARWALDEPLSSAVVERAHELRNRGWRDVMRFESRAATRPVAILLQESLREISPLPPTPHQLGSAVTTGRGTAIYHQEPRPFVGQRQWIRQQLRSPVGWLRLAGNLCRIDRWPKVRWGR